jgi:ABC-type histidine transport system ATPase subunit
MKSIDKSTTDEKDGSISKKEHRRLQVRRAQKFVVFSHFSVWFGKVFLCVISYKDNISSNNTLLYCETGSVQSH